MKNIEGVWSLEFYGAYGWDVTGVVVLSGSRCVGGGRKHCVQGSYQVRGKKVGVKLELDNYGKVSSLFGLKERYFKVALDGEHKNGKIVGEATRPDDDVIPLQFRLIRRNALS